MESSLVSPDHLFLHIRPDSVADSFRSEQVNPAAEDVLKEEGEVHEVPKRRVLELNKYVYVAFFGLFSSDKGAEEANPPHCESTLDLLLVVSEDLDCFQHGTPLRYFM